MDCIEIAIVITDCAVFHHKIHISHPAGIKSTVASSLESDTQTALSIKCVALHFICSKWMRESSQKILWHHDALPL